jgi:hypothetical protein
MLQNASEEPAASNFNDENVFVCHEEKRNNFRRKIGNDLLHYKAPEDRRQKTGVFSNEISPPRFRKS